MTERWSHDKYVELKKVDDFLNEIIEVSKKHGMSISHEDGHGSFIVILNKDDDCYSWLFNANVEKII